MNSYVYNFEELVAPKLSQVGGKAANLIKLSKIEKVNLPEGFCITTAAYTDIFNSNEVVGSLLTQLSLININELDRISEISGQIREVIVNTIIPESIMNEIRGCLQSLGENQSYAVRSSATTEDQPKASFAGQHDSYLNISGIDAIVEKVSQCWASLFTDRAVTYRIQNGIDHRKVWLAVVVQEMVSADTSGVMFTADPITSNRKTVSIDASYGLGEDLVSGLVNGDNYKVCNGEITSCGQNKTQILTDSQLLELEGLGRTIEAYFECPQDIEWCILENRIYIVQSRPITTLYPLPDVKKEEKRVFVSSGHMQMMTDPIKPLGMYFFKSVISDPPCQEIGGRLYLDVTNDLNTPFARLITKYLLKVIGDTLITNSVGKIISHKQFIKSLPKGKEKVFNLDNNSGAASIMLHAYKAYKKNDPDIIRDIINKEEESIEEMKMAIQTLSGDDVFEFIAQDHQDRRLKLMKPPNAGVMTAVMLSSNGFSKKVKKWIGEVNAADTIIMSVPNSITTDTGFALMDVADVIRNYPQIIEYLKNPSEETFFEDLCKFDGGKLVSDSIKDYLSQYGMRCSGDIDITVARWIEKPTELMPMILSNIKNFEPNARKEKFEEGINQSEIRIQELARKIEQAPRGKRKAKKVIKMASLIRNYIGYREYPKFSYMKRYLIYKEAMLKEAESLLQSGVIDEIEDVYYLYYDEFRAIINGKALDKEVIRNRKNDYESYEKLTPPRVMISDGEIITSEYELSKLPENALPGLPVSAGVVEGRARIVKSIKDATFSEGDILIAEFTDPSWTPAFVSIKGLITEVGGLVTHGAIIAREYGLPAVVSVKDATKLIKEGQLIRLNGTEGYVEILSE